MSEIKYLCCYCGVFIKKNRANLDRHEKLHEELINKIKCAIKKCEATFQNKSNYWAHWKLKHSNKTMPNSFNFVEMKTKRRKMNRNHIYEDKNTATANGFEFELELNSESAIAFEFNNVKIECLMREPFFGELR